MLLGYSISSIFNIIISIPKFKFNNENYEGSLTIPEDFYIGDTFLSVLSLNVKAFKNANIAEIILQNSIKAIGFDSFFNV
jgi:hypothetical protein